MPVIALNTAVEEGLPEKEGVISVPWPCETKVLVDRIEAALLDLPASSTTQARTGGVRLGSPNAPVRSAGNPMWLVGGTGPPREPRLPPGYSLDRSDPDVLVLLCPTGTAVAHFSARGAKAEAIEREARDAL